MGLTVVTTNSWPHCKAQNFHLYLKYLKDIFVLLQKKNLNWSLTISLIQLREICISIWPFLTSLSCTGWWFHSLVFKMHQNEESTFSISFPNQRNLSKKASSALNIKNKEWRCPILVSFVSVKNILRKIEDFLCVLGMVSFWPPFHKIFVFFLNKILHFLQFDAVSYKKRNSFSLF